MPTKNIKPIRRSNLWWCETCHTKEMPFAALKKHLLNVHQIDTAKTKARRQLTLHLDCADHFTSQYAVTVKSGRKTITLTQCVTCPREKNDPFRRM